MSWLLFIPHLFHIKISRSQKIVLDNFLKSLYNFSMKIRNLTAKYSSHKGGRHTSAKDYNRQQLKQETKQMSEESKAPDFSVSQSWQDLSKWEKANDVIVYGYLDAQEILEHFEGEEGWQYYDKNAILEAMKFAYDKSSIDWTYQDYLETIGDFLADMKEYPAGYGC